MAGLNQSLNVGREPLKGPQVYSGPGKQKVVPASEKAQPAVAQGMPNLDMPHLAQQQPQPQPQPPVKIPDFKWPAEWSRILPAVKDIVPVVKGFLPHMLDPGGVSIVQQGSGETIRQAQWQQQLKTLQFERNRLEGIERRWIQEGLLSDFDREQAITKPKAARVKEIQQLERMIPVVTQQKERLARGQRKLEILLAEQPDQTVLQSRWVAMQAAHQTRVQKAHEGQTLLNQQLLKAVDKNPDEALMRVTVAQEEVRMAQEEAAILNELSPEVQGLLKQPLDHETIVKQAKQLQQTRAASVQSWADKATELQARKTSQRILQGQAESVSGRLDHPEYFPYEHWTAEEKTEALAVVQDYTQGEIRKLDKAKADIEWSQQQLLAGGLDALRLPQDHPALEKQWGKHVMVSVATGQEQSAIFKEHFKSLMARAKTAESLPAAMVETAQNDAKEFVLKRPFGLGSERVYSTPMVSTNHLDIWKKKDDTVKKRVVVYIQGHHHVDAQKEWMDSDEVKMKAQLSEDFKTGDTPLVWVPFKGKTKQEVLQALTDLKSQATPDTEFLVVMNGHGMQVPSENETLDPRLEGSPVGHFQLTATEDLTDNEMKDALQHLSGSGGVLLWLSSCHGAAWLAQHDTSRKLNKTRLQSSPFQSSPDQGLTALA